LFNESVTVEEDMVHNELTVDQEPEPEQGPEPEIGGFKFGAQFSEKKAKDKGRKQPKDEDIIDVDASGDEKPFSRTASLSRSKIKKKVDGACAFFWGGIEVTFN